MFQTIARDNKEEALARLSSREGGLSEDEAARRLLEFLKNKFTQP